MPKNVTETAVPLTSGSNALPEFRFEAVPYIAGTFETIAQRLHVGVTVYASRNTDDKLTSYHQTYHVGDELDEFDPGDAAALRALLLKLYNQVIADRGL